MRSEAVLLHLVMLAHFPPNLPLGLMPGVTDDAAIRALLRSASRSSFAARAACRARTRSFCFIFLICRFSSKGVSPEVSMSGSSFSSASCWFEGPLTMFDRSWACSTLTEPFMPGSIFGPLDTTTIPPSSSSLPSSRLRSVSSASSWLIFSIWCSIVFSVRNLACCWASSSTPRARDAFSALMCRSFFWSARIFFSAAVKRGSSSSSA
mmetsp:Transcript_5577/g.17155  ORF Transcript_5577/g.17155 Transcript_5577/m.17155 type:complete len:208 (+) Transcript_5577:86-709(+)